MNTPLRAMILTQLAGICAVLSYAEPAQTGPAAYTLPARISYAAKFVCGLSKTATNAPPQEPQVKNGNYATVINIHNPWPSTVVLLKKVALAAPEKYPQTVLIPPTRRFQDKLPSDHGMSVDCTEIVNLLTLNGTPPTGTFSEGDLVIDSSFGTGAANSAALDVVAVTTTSDDVGMPVNSHEIVTVPGRSLPAGTWPF